MIKIKNGNKLYPTCKWESNQHKMFNYYDRMYLKMLDSDYEDSAVDACDEAERLLDVFNSGVCDDGLVYAEYADYTAIKEIIVAYDMRH